ncbi:MAG: AMP-binding protein, partial [Parachlamydiaceae bacterium]
MPNKICLSHITETGEIKTITYKELLEKSLSVANFIKSETKEGDTVILCFPTGFDFLISFFGCMFAGVIAIPCMPPINQESAKRMNLIIKNSHATLALSDRKVLSAFKKLNFFNLLDNAITKPFHNLLAPIHRNIKIESDNRWVAIEDIPLEKNVSPFCSKRFEEPLFLQYTSGSTSMPKGVKISMKNLMANFDMITHVVKWKGEEINCQTWMPLYHDMGLIGTVLYPLYRAGHGSIMSPIDFLKKPAKWLEALT